MQDLLHKKLFEQHNKELQSKNILILIWLFCVVQTLKPWTAERKIEFF